MEKKKKKLKEDSILKNRMAEYTHFRHAEYSIEGRAEKIIDFICKKANVEQNILTKTYQLMVDVGLMRNFGYENKVYSICPDVIREDILKEKILFNKKISDWGNLVIDGLIANEIPCVEDVVESLSRIENNEDEIDVLGKFVESIETRFKSEPLENHSKLWSVVERMAVNRPEEILDFVEDILKTYRLAKDVDEYILQLCCNGVKDVLSVCLYSQASGLQVPVL